MSKRHCLRPAPIFCFALSLTAACSRPPGPEQPPMAVASALASRLGSRLDCPRYRHQVAGIVADDRLTEASGLAASRRHPGVLYSHNDSGDGPRILAFRTDGRSLCRYELAGVAAMDWEDIGIASCPGRDRDCLYVADIGGNRRPRRTVTVYQVPEPDDAELPGPSERRLEEAVRISLEYPRGAHDSEAFLIDPRELALYIVTKNVTGRSRVFRARVPEHPTDAPIVLEVVATVVFGAPPLGHNPLITGGAFSPSGDAFLLKTYSTAYLWTVERGETVEAALGRAPCPLLLSSEPQGEAACFAADGRGYFTLSEGLYPPLHYFSRE